MSLFSSLRTFALGCLVVAGCADSQAPATKGDQATAFCSLTGTPTPTPTPFPDSPIATAGEAFAAPVVDFCCAGGACAPMSEILGEIETDNFCESGDAIEAEARLLTDADIVASGRQVYVAGEQVDALYGGCEPDTGGENPTCGDGTLVLELDSTDEYVIAFRTDGSEDVYAVPEGVASVKLPSEGLKSFGFLIKDGNPWANAATEVRFLGKSYRLDLQTDWVLMGLGGKGVSGATATKICRGTKC